MPEVTRRNALKLVVAGAAGAAACGKSAADTSSAGPAPAAPAGSIDPVLHTAKLDSVPWKTQDPFLFCVHHDDRYPAGNERLGPAASLQGRSIGQDFAGIDGWRMYHGDVVPGFPRHPHRGFETVTVVRRGLLDHADSMGATARYGQGDVQWLTAGKGIQHAEMFPLLDAQNPNPVELFQIWLNLPATDKMVEPHFTMFWKDRVPEREERDDDGRATRLTLVAGGYGPANLPPPPPSSWARRPESDVAIWTIAMEPSARWTLPAARPGSNRTLYLFAGSELRVGQRVVPAGHRIELRADQAVALQCGERPAEMLMLQGRPIGEPVARQGPFVMNSDAEIRQAYADYRRTGFGGWPWERHDPVHERGEGRFARHADGKTERPA